MGPYEEWSEDRARELLTPLAGERGALLPILQRLQQVFGYVHASAVPLVADALNWSQAEVHGVLTFYRDFRTSLPGRRVVRICRAEACQSVGARSLVAHAAGAAGLVLGETAADGSLTLDEVYCLGNCALGPSVQVDGDLLGRVTVAEIERLVAGAGEPGSPGDRTGHLAAPVAGPAPPVVPPAAPPVVPPAAPPVVPPAARPVVPPAGAAPAVTVYVPADAAARSVGADGVGVAVEAEAAARGLTVELVRNGSWGMCWLEPLVEVATAAGRIAYGPVSAGDVAGLFAAGFLTGGAHELRHGATEGIDYLARQTRHTFRRVGNVDPRSLEDYESAGGLAGLRRALALQPEQIVDEIATSGLRGRGGAGFPAGVKWRTVLETPGAEKFVCVNADEGDSGTFADRMLMEGDPFALVEGAVIAGLAVGAAEGWVYLRSEYPDAARMFAAALRTAEEHGLTGGDVLGSGRPFTLRLRTGAGSYVCGEETAMLESLEGRRGVVRARPPLPAHAGLFGRPTLVHNVLTLAAVPAILADSAGAYQALGSGRSRGTQVVQLAGNVRRGGIVEVPFGISLRTLVEDFGGGTRSGRPVRAVQVGGPLGAYLPAGLLDTPLDYEALAAAGGMLGHGGIVVFDDTVDMAEQARFAMEFCAEESCGKCTPCRVGAVRGVEVIDRMQAAVDAEALETQRALLEDLCATMTDGSLCAMGGLTPMPVTSALAHFPEDFGPRITAG